MAGLVELAATDRSIFSQRRLAFVGVAKNSGKTTAMNYVLRRGAQLSKRLGAVSIGLDGEQMDGLLGTPKPPVRVSGGQTVVSSEKSLAGATARFGGIEPLGFDTPLGPTVLATVDGPGEVVLSGIRHRRDLLRVVDRMRDCDHILIDGAYGRTMAAHSDACDAVLVSTGAVVAESAQAVADATRSLISRLVLPSATGWRAELMREAISRDRTLLGGAGTTSIALPGRSALVGLPQVRAMWSDATTAIACLGVISPKVAQELLRARESGHVIVPSSSAVQLEARQLDALTKRWTIEALSPVQVAAISINPTSPQGHRVDRQHLARLISDYAPNIPVFDAHSGLEWYD